MNWSGFASGLARGVDDGVRIGKSVQEIIRERKLQELRDQGMQEANAQREASLRGVIQETGVSNDPLPGQASAQPAQAEQAPAPTAEPAAQQPAQPVEAPQVAPVEQPTSQAAAPAVAPQPAQQAPAAPTPSTVAQAGIPAAQPTPQQTAPAVAQPTPAAEQAAAPDVSQKPSGRFVVKGIDGKTFDTREDAMAAAEKLAPSAADLFIKNAVPKIIGQYLVNGEPDKAEAWQKYADSYNGKRLMKDWAAAFTAPDLDTAAQRFGKFYSDHIDDGVDYVGHKMLTKADGSQVAIVSLKDTATGKTTDMEIDRNKMLQLAGQANPQHLFELEYAKQSAAQKLQAEYALKGAEQKQKLNDSLTLEDRKAKNQRELEGIKGANKATEINITQDRLDARERIKSKLSVEERRGEKQADLDTKIDALLGAGYSEEDVRKMMPAIVGAGEHKKTTDPAERRALIASDLLKNDPAFANASKEKQAQKVNDVMGVIYGDGAPATDSPAGKPAQAPKSAVVIADKPMAYDPKLPVKYRKGDGKPFHVVNGQYVPIEGAVPPQAGGLPKR